MERLTDRERTVGAARAGAHGLDFDSVRAEFALPDVGGRHPGAGPPGRPLAADIAGRSVQFAFPA